jgi:hypothetical protein
MDRPIIGSKTCGAGGIWDVVVVGLLGVAALVTVSVAFDVIGPSITHYSTWDYWFECDAPAITSQLLDRWSNYNQRAVRHPLFSLFLAFPTQLLRSGFDFTPLKAITITVALRAAAWVSVFFLCLRSLGIRRGDAALFTCLASSSASAVFWFPIPETFAPGALSIALAFMISAWSERQTCTSTKYLAASVITLSITLTNWMVGLAMLFARFSWKRALTLSFITLVAVSVAYEIEMIIFPATPPLLGIFTELGNTSFYIFNSQGLGPLAKLNSFFFHSMIMPEVGNAYGFRLSVQAALPGSGSLLAAVGVVVWSALLMCGGWSGWQLRGVTTVRVLLLSIFGQVILAQIFGLETFLYSAHFGQLLVLLTALSALTSARRLALLLALALLGLATINNVQKFATAAAGIRQKYNDEHEFTQKVQELTKDDGLIICGRHAAAATGCDSQHCPLPDLQNMPVTELRYPEGLDEPCFFKFNDVGPSRHGWVLMYDSWSIESIQTLRRRGARYFISPYQYGIRTNSVFLSELDRSASALDRDPKWVFYGLR